MTDKSFGDHMNRNIVKNPLLSTAVTGLSIEDLTHNAVLLPVSLAQEVISRPDNQFGSQDRALRNPDYVISSWPSGDANANTTPPYLPPNTQPTASQPQQSIKTDKHVEKPCSTQAKASVKSDDDFDVNEYFARLHGTRYVSAPLNLHKEDTNANIEETEDNLEEINLNEPDKTDVNQSITADIAQNFSQLPTVLPQVASAVFSSFSNMLSMKSREHTPDEVKPSYQEAQLRADIGVPLMVSDTAKEVAPPPKEPPTVGTGNYRLVTKKKYAQIPGLTSQAQIFNPTGQNMPHYNPTQTMFNPLTTHYDSNQTISINTADNDPTRPNIPTYYNPNIGEAYNSNSQAKSSETDATRDPVENLSNLLQTTLESKAKEDATDKLQQNYSVFNPAAIQMNIPTAEPNLNNTYPSSAENKPVEKAPSISQSFSNQIEIATDHIQEVNQAPRGFYNAQETPTNPVSTGIIPPPPMFSNLPRRDSQTGIQKSILPPSVARRISANQPIIKPQTSAIPTFAENIFVPAPIDSSESSLDSFSGLQGFYGSNDQSVKPPSAFAQFNIAPQSVPVTSHTSVPLSSASVPSNLPPTSCASLPPSLPKEKVEVTVTSLSIHQASIAPPPMSNPAATKSSLQIGSQQILSPKPKIPAQCHQTNETNDAPPPMFFNPNAFTGAKTTFGSGPQTELANLTQQSTIGINVTLGSASNILPSPFYNSSTVQQPSIFTPPSSTQSQESINVPNFCNPGTSMLSPSLQSQVPTTSLPPLQVLTSGPLPTVSPDVKLNQGIPQSSHFIDPTSTEISKPVPEPPKAVGNVNFRMAKRRPQYYSGPIEGIGAISNNVKPVINPVETGAFQGALFTPTSQVDDIKEQNVVAAPSVAPSASFDIIPAETSPNTHFEFNEPTIIPPVYNTAFDLSRSTTETFEPPKQETSGFGIIGSLKSKLSSIDINKIHNSVTNFFDPAYNEVKREDHQQTGMAYHPPQQAPYQQQSLSAYGQQYAYGQNQSSNFEIFVPNVEQSQYTQHAYMGPQNQSNSFQGNQYQQNPSNYYQGQEHMYSMNYANPSVLKKESWSVTSADFTQDKHDSNANLGQSKADNESQPAAPQSLHFAQNMPHLNTENANLVHSDASQIEISTVSNYIQQGVRDFGLSKIPVTSAQAAENDRYQFDSTVNFFDITPEKESFETKSPESNQPEKLVENINQKRKDSRASDFFDTKETTIPTVSNVPQSLIGAGDFKSKASYLQKTDNWNKMSNTSLNAPSSSFHQGESNLSDKLLGFERVQSKPSESKLAQSSDSEFQIKFDVNSESFFDISQQSAQTTQRPTPPTDTSNAEVIETEKFDGDISTKYDENINQRVFESTPLSFFDHPQKVDGPEKKFSELQRSNDESIKHQECKTSINPLLYPDSYFSSDGNENKNDCSGSPNKASITDQNKAEIKDVPMSCVPLLSLSTMLADKSKELSEIENNALDLPTDIDTIFNRNANSDFFNINQAAENKPEFVENPDEASELNICETCREVDKHAEKCDKRIDDLTAKLIENINSPIQLLNPVGVPLCESNTDLDRDLPNFEPNQCAEISHITEETIEAIQVQSVTELLDDDINANIKTYGWSNEETSFPTSKVLLEHDYLPSDPNTIGFFGDSLFITNIPKNASDELKAEIKFTHEETPVLQKQMSIPSAPPAEDDSKSDGIDVHSIELDAKQDFPALEEYVIEPSETDDDKIELIESQRSSEDQELDSFTNRVERYKKLEEKKASPVMNLVNTPSSSLPMASYFDTGNYAAETHFRNSLTSPPNLTTFSILKDPQMRVPPGFEEDYQRRLSGTIPLDVGFTIESIPCNFESSISKVGSVPESECIEPRKFSETVQELKDVELRGFSDSTLDKKGVHDNRQFGSHGLNLITDTKELIQTQGSEDIEPRPLNLESLSDVRNIFGAKSLEVSKETAPKSVSLFTNAKPDTQKTIPTIPLKEAPILEDPMNFFASNTEYSSDQKTEDSGGNRLASYFSSPAKTESTKSFFELSQGQDHYRQKGHSSHVPIAKTHSMNVKDNKFIYDQSQNSIDCNLKITQDRLANLNLLKDLTSIQNAEFKPEQIVRTVNYFSVEYDNKSLNHPEITNSSLLNNPQFEMKDVGTNPTKIPNVSSDFIFTTEKDTNVEIYERSEQDTQSDFAAVIMKCRSCRSIGLDCLKAYGTTDREKLGGDYKVKQCMNVEKSEANNTVEGNMDRSDNPGSAGSICFNVDTTVPEGANNGVEIVPDENRFTPEYLPVQHHWFYRIDIEDKSTWRGFSVVDSNALETAFNSPDLDEHTVVATDGGRYDVNIISRLRTAVYWQDNPSDVRRCSWFYKGTTDARYLPYTEDVARKLEEEFHHGLTTGEWHRRLVLPNNELVVMHGPAVMVHFVKGGASDAFGTPPLQHNLIQMLAFGKRVYRNPPKIKLLNDQPVKIDHLILLVHGAGEYRHQKEKTQSTMRPRVVRRGHDESEIEDVEPSSIDHLLLMCHGVGSACDMRFRSVEEVVDDFRTTSLQLIQSHYKSSYDSGDVGRVEVLPISWHATLHSGETGVDRRLAQITLDSIPRLRSFTNDTVLDVLFYTSPVFCQTIVDTVCKELNRIYGLFMSRNPGFAGGVSVGGHSLGSVILYDLLCHQEPNDAKGSTWSADKRYVTGAAGTGQPSVTYPKLTFNPVALYALGSPIAIFECIRGVEQLGPEFALPTCGNFFNIFHPYDPIAYRIEPLICPQMRDVKPFLIPHHKGRKRMHLELKDTMARVGADIKQKLVESIKSTWSNMWKTQSATPPTCQLERVVEEEISKKQLMEEPKEDPGECPPSPEMLGKLNQGRRIDYVLQEAPFEMINEYIFAMGSHVCYWESEDTMLLMLREIYDALGVQPDTTVPQPNLTVQRSRQVKNDKCVVKTEIPSTSRDGT